MGRVLGFVRPACASGGSWCLCDWALAGLALPGTFGEAGEATTGPAPKGGAESADLASPSPVTDGVRLYVLGAHVVSTQRLGAVTEALATPSPPAGSCVCGDPGHGKTVVVHRALRLLPRCTRVHRALVAVKPALPQLRAALLTVFGLPATVLTNRTDAADRAPDSTALRRTRSLGTAAFRRPRRWTPIRPDPVRQCCRNPPEWRGSAPLSRHDAECRRDDSTPAHAPGLRHRSGTQRTCPRAYRLVGGGRRGRRGRRGRVRGAGADGERGGTWSHLAPSDWR